MKKVVALVLTGLLPAGALAHSKVQETTPAHGATIDAAPAEIGLTFDKGIRLTRVEMVHDNSPSVSLELGEQTGFDRVFAVPLPTAETGLYVIEWRGLGEDGHVMQGEFSFTVE